MSLHIFLGQWKVDTWDEIFKIFSYKCKIPSRYLIINYVMWHWKRTWEPLHISINRGPQPRGRGILEIQIFFKTSSSSNKTLSRVLKPPSSMLEVYKEQSSIGSSLNAPLEFFNNTLKTNQRYSSRIKSPYLASQYTSKFTFLQNTNPCLISQINQVTIHQIQVKNQMIAIFFWKNILHRDFTHSYI